MSFQKAFKKGISKAFTYKLIIDQVNVSRQCIHDFLIVSFDLLTCHTRNGLSAEAKSFPTKNSSSKALPNGSAVRETLASILSLSSFTRPVKAVYQTRSFTSILLDRFT